MARKIEGAAVEKRGKISKSQQHIIIAVLITSVILGVCVVLMVYLIKYIGFYSKVMGVKDESIKKYAESVINVGICKDQNKDGTISARELSECDPNAISSTEIEGSLRSNIMTKTAYNKSLEAVARAGQGECYDGEEKIDYNQRYEEATNDTERAEAMKMVKTCSALRVIPDALPAQENEEAMLASLNQIFILSDWEPESIAPASDSSSSSSYSSSSSSDGGSSGIADIPVAVSVEADSAKTITVLKNMEKSIRTFEVGKATISWSGDNLLTLEAKASSYYTEESAAREYNETVYATDEAKKNSTSSSSTSGGSK